MFGTPDISNKLKQFAVFIDGCFWHGCPRCYKEPKSNIDYWGEKIIRKKKRRTTVRRYLHKEGWTIFEFWEHSINKNIKKIYEKIFEKMNA